MEKPLMRTRLAIDWFGENSRVIVFFTEPEIAQEFSEFGKLEPEGSRYTLTVDPRFDFQEVVTFVRQREGDLVINLLKEALG